MDISSITVMMSEVTNMGACALVRMERERKVYIIPDIRSVISQFEEDWDRLNKMIAERNGLRVRDVGMYSGLVLDESEKQLFFKIVEDLVNVGMEEIEGFLPVFH